MRCYRRIDRMELTNIETRLTADDFQREKAYFLSYLSVKGRKDSTIRTYDEALRSIHRTLCNIGVIKSLRTVTPDEVIQLKDALRVSETSKKLYLIVLGRLQECFGMDNAVKNADILWNHCEPRRLFIRPEDFKVMMASCDERERLVLMLGAYMGLRRSEICNLRVSDITSNIATIHGKGHGGEGKVAHIKMPRPVVIAYENYLAHRVYDTDHILQTGDGRRMSSACLGRLVKRVAKRNGVLMTPHSLRRLFATTLYETGADLNTVRVLMRHESVNTTVNCYINVNPVMRDDAVNALCAVLG